MAKRTIIIKRAAKLKKSKRVKLSVIPLVKSSQIANAAIVVGAIISGFVMLVCLNCIL